MNLDGRYVVGRHWHRWTVLDQSHNPPVPVGRPLATEADAQAAADQLNTPRTPPQRTRQASLFDTQEVPAP